MKRTGSGKSADNSKKKHKTRQPDPPSICAVCSTPLLSGSHVKCRRNELSWAGGDGREYSFYRKEDQCFHCSSCEFKEKNREVFKTHVETVHINGLEQIEEDQDNMENIEEAIGDAGTSTPDLSEGAEIREFLERYRLAICDRLLICIECKSVLDFTKIRKHFLTDRHKGIAVPMTMQKDFDDTILRYHHTLIAQPEHPQIPIPQIPYLETGFKFMRCLSCNRCYKGPETYSQHTCLPEGRRGDIALYDCQRYVANNSSPWFPIIKAPTIPFDRRNATTYELWLKKRNEQQVEALDGSQIDETRILHQFLVKEGWLEQVKKCNLPRNTLMQFAQVTPREPTLVKLGSLIYSFLRRVQESTPHNTLRRMIGLRPAAEHDVTSQRHHFNVSNATLKKYSRTLVGVLQLVTRSVPGYPFPVSGSTKKLADSLFLKLKSSSVSKSTFDVEDDSTG